MLSQSAQWLLPPSVEELVPKNHPVKVVSATVDEIELKALFEAYTKADAVKSIDLLLSDWHLFIAADCQTVPRKRHQVYPSK